MQTTLATFERIDGLRSSLAHMGSFETCADPREHIRTSNRLLDACVDAGMDYATNGGFDSHEEWAADYLTRCLSSATMVRDAA